MAKNTIGATIFTWTNDDFVEGDLNERTVSLTPIQTVSYATGEFNYELQVTTDTGTYTWMQGYVQVLDQITS